MIAGCPLKTMLTDQHIRARSRIAIAAAKGDGAVMERRPWPQVSWRLLTSFRRDLREPSRTGNRSEFRPITATPGSRMDHEVYELDRNRT